MPSVLLSFAILFCVQTVSVSPKINSFPGKKDLETMVKFIETGEQEEAEEEEEDYDEDYDDDFGDDEEEDEEELDTDGEDEEGDVEGTDAHDEL